MPPATAKKTRVTKKRRYHSPLRQQQSAETREKIIAAGAELVRELPTWDWKNLSVRAVSERAGVSERTVHRHFTSERKMRDAVLGRLTEESGIHLEQLTLDNFADTTGQTFRYLSSFAASHDEVTDPSQAHMDSVRREALLKAVANASPNWEKHDRDALAALLDMLWNPPAYERMLAAWKLEPEQAIDAIGWLAGLIEQAVRDGNRPGAGR